MVVCLSVKPAIDLQPVQVVPCPLLEVRRDWVQLPRDPLAEHLKLPDYRFSQLFSLVLRFGTVLPGALAFQHPQRAPHEPESKESIKDNFTFRLS